MNDKTNDQELLADCYCLMYRGMIDKDAAALKRVLDDSFVLLHMTGMHQSKQEYIDAILDGTLNYYTEKTEKLSVSVYGDTAQVIGESRVSAAVFGGGRHTWSLRVTMQAAKTPEGWRFTRAEASTW